MISPFYTYHRVHFTSGNASFLDERTNGRAIGTVNIFIHHEW